MHIFTHLGITVGSIWVIQQAVNQVKRSIFMQKPSYISTKDSSLTVDKTGPNQRSTAKWLDYRFLALGAVLPDLIDKTFGVVFLGNGRGFCHSIILTLVLSVITVLLFKTRKSPILISIVLGWFIHLLLDTMWQKPTSFFWPLLGWDLKNTGTTFIVWAGRIFSSLIHKPYEYIPELICTISFGFIFIDFLQHGKITRLIKRKMISFYHNRYERFKHRFASTAVILDKRIWANDGKTILVSKSE
jgi:membrane-bound metal-dependent hydrolase YbcI (DUF457 family)